MYGLGVSGGCDTCKEGMKQLDGMEVTGKGCEYGTSKAGNGGG